MKANDHKLMKEQFDKIINDVKPVKLKKGEYRYMYHSELWWRIDYQYDLMVSKNINKPDSFHVPTKEQLILYSKYFLQSI